MTKREYYAKWCKEHPENMRKYAAKQAETRKKKQRKCWHCHANIPTNRRICDVCSCTAIICCMCGKSVLVLRSKRRYKTSYFCSKECQFAFFRKTNIWKMYFELQRLRMNQRCNSLNEQIIKSQQQQIDELLENNKELRQRNKELELIPI